MIHGSAASDIISIPVKADVFCSLLICCCQLCVNTMLRRKDISNNFREATVAAPQPGKGYKAISKQFGVHHSTVSEIAYKWKTFKTGASLSGSGSSDKFTSRSDCAMLRKTFKKSRAKAQTLQVSVSLLNVKFHDSTFKKRLNRFGRILGESLFSLNNGSTADVCKVASEQTAKPLK